MFPQPLVNKCEIGASQSRLERYMFFPSIGERLRLMANSGFGLGGAKINIIIYLFFKIVKII